MPAVPGQMRELPSEAPEITCFPPTISKQNIGRSMDLNGGPSKNSPVKSVEHKREIMNIIKEEPPGLFFAEKG